MSAIDRSLPRPGALSHPALAWLENPAAYGALVPVVVLAGAGTTLLAPMLLDPAAFGAFALLTTMFQYTGAADLGLSQLADRRIVAERASDGDDILRARWQLALWLAAIATPAAALVAWGTGLPVVATALAVLAGCAFMAGNGPVCAHRAAARVGLFTMTALLLHVGLTVPRLAGLALGGVTGCFALLALWYVGLALVLARPSRRAAKRYSPHHEGSRALDADAGQCRSSLALRDDSASCEAESPQDEGAGWLTRHEPALAPMLRAGLPLFAFNGAWLVTVSAARWGSFAVSADDARFGLFAFALNFLIVGTGIVSTVSQVWYPRLLTRLATDRPAAACRIAADATWLVLAAAAGSVVAALIAEPLVARLFPHFAEAGMAFALLAAAAAPMALVAATMPLSIALSREPWRDALMVFGAPLALVVPAMWIGDRVSGIEGQAVACVIDVCGLAALQCAMLRRVGAMSGAGAWRCVALAIGLALAVLVGTGVAKAQDRPLYRRPPESALTFRDDFTTLRLWSRAGGLWQPFLPWGGRTIADNAERQYYVDPRLDPPALARLDPFSVQGELVVTARPIPPADRGKAAGLAYASGLLTTAKSFSQTFGYFEIRAKLPRGRGLWPAVWLAPLDQSWPPEIDVMEAHGDRLGGYWGTLHSIRDDETQFRIATPDLADDFHDFGLEWRRDRMLWTFDGRIVASAPTPPDMRKPMYLLIDLAIGGTWPGDPDATTPFPARLEVQRVSAYRIAEPDREPNP